MMLMNLNGWFILFLEKYVYALPEPPRRKRTKPMQVICVGLPRTGTESLQHALLRLGYDHTFHGWDINYEEPSYCPQWVRLCRKKYFGPTDGNSTITAADFDALIGHSVAVTDAVGSVFAAELIAAYPDAKVILNQRDDIDAWHRSLVNANARVFLSWPVFLVFGALSWLSPDCFWAWQVYVRFMWPGLFRALDGNIATGMERNGKWVYREHYNMVRGLVPKERRLEWTVQDGWEPLCKFLGKDIPDESFPRTNTGAGWAGQESKLMRRYLMGAVRTIVMLTTVAVPAGLIWYKTMR